MSELEYLTQRYPMDAGFKNPLGRKGGYHNIANVEPGYSAGATNVIQRGYKRIKSGKKPKRNAKFALKLIEATQSSGIQRFQRIGPYESFNNNFNAPGSLSIGHENVVITRQVGGISYTEQAVAYPVHLFDLTSGNFYTPGVPIEDVTIGRTGRYVYAPCHWRLLAYQSGSPGGTAGDFYWFPENGQTQAGASSAPSNHWITERNNSSVTTNTVAAQRRSEYFYFSDKCIYDWADLRLALYGARTQTTKFTLSLVQITDRMYDPRQFRPATLPVGFTGNSDGVYNAWYDSTTKGVEAQRNFNAAMQEMVQPLIFHPLHSAGATKIDVFKTLMRKSYVIGPDSNTNEDGGQPNILVKFFKRLNRMVNYAWDDTPTIGNDTDLDAPVFNQYLERQVKGYAHPRAKLYLMVTAQAFTEVGGVGQPESTADNTPGFDIVIRRHITYDHVTRPAQMPFT